MHDTHEYYVAFAYDGVVDYATFVTVTSTTNMEFLFSRDTAMTLAAETIGLACDTNATTVYITTMHEDGSKDMYHVYVPTNKGWDFADIIFSREFDALPVEDVTVS